MFFLKKNQNRRFLKRKLGKEFTIAKTFVFARGKIIGISYEMSLFMKKTEGASPFPTKFVLIYKKDGAKLRLT